MHYNIWLSGSVGPFLFWILFFTSALVTARLLAEKSFLTASGPELCHVLWYQPSTFCSNFLAYLFLSFTKLEVISAKSSTRFGNKKKKERINFSACSMAEIIFVSGDLCRMTYILKPHNLCSSIPVLASLQFFFLECADVWLIFVELISLMSCHYWVFPRCGVPLASCR